MRPNGGVQGWRKGLAAPIVVGIVLRILVMLIIHAVHGQFLFVDDQHYDFESWGLASAWHLHAYASPEAYAGAFNYGYVVYVAVIYYVVGHSVVAVGLINAALAGVAVYFAGEIASEVGGMKFARPAAWLVALYPSAIFWGAVGLKDGLDLTIWLATVAIALRGLTLRRLIALAGLLVATVLTRPPLAVASLIVIAIPLLQAFRGRRAQPVRGGRQRVSLGLLTLGAVGFAVVALLLPYKHLLLPSTTSGPILGADHFSLSGFNPRSIALSVLGPPWPTFLAGASPYSALFPGMILWTSLLGVSILGAWDALRRGSPRLRGLVVAVIVYLALYMSYSSYANGFFRERFDAEVIFVILGLNFFRQHRRDAVAITAIWMCVATTVDLALVNPRDVAIVVVALMAAGAALMARRLRDQSAFLQRLTSRVRMGRYDETDFQVPVGNAKVLS